MSDANPGDATMGDASTGDVTTSDANTGDTRMQEDAETEATALAVTSIDASNDVDTTKSGETTKEETIENVKQEDVADKAEQMEDAEEDAAASTPATMKDEGVLAAATTVATVAAVAETNIAPVANNNAQGEVATDVAAAAAAAAADDDQIVVKIGPNEEIPAEQVAQPSEDAIVTDANEGETAAAKESDAPAKETKKRIRRVGRTPTRKIPKLDETALTTTTMDAGVAGNVGADLAATGATDAATAAIGAAPEAGDAAEISSAMAIAPPPNEGVLSKHDEKWHSMFQKLLEFKERNKHTLVPQCYAEDARLGRWVHYQRVEYWIFQQRGSAKITEERIARLNTIGFEWDPQKAQWEKMFAKLKQFKKEFSHCRVPKGYDKDWELANWVRNQRLEQANLSKQGKKSRMTPERFKLLDDLGFKWSSPTPARARRTSKPATGKKATSVSTNREQTIEPKTEGTTGVNRSVLDQKAAETTAAATEGGVVIADTSNVVDVTASVAAPINGIDPAAPAESAADTIDTVAPVETATEVVETTASVETSTDVTNVEAPVETTADVVETAAPVETTADVVETATPVETTEIAVETAAPIETATNVDGAAAPVETIADAVDIAAPIEADTAASIAVGEVEDPTKIGAQDSAPLDAAKTIEI